MLQQSCRLQRNMTFLIVRVQGRISATKISVNYSIYSDVNLEVLSGKLFLLNFVKDNSRFREKSDKAKDSKSTQNTTLKTKVVVFLSL